jgi:hypothetical protein
LSEAEFKRDGLNNPGKEISRQQIIQAMSWVFPVTEI